ncbi:MAG: DUF975 domain-containing protein [Cyanobacteria bacterium P01_A01_bin.45]
MSGSFNSPIPVQSLSIGNVVSAALRLYRSHLKRYLGIALKASLWALIPIYGWAKSYLLNATISRLAYQELINQPESVTEAQDQNHRKFWGFWLAQFIVGLILFGVNMGVSIVQSIVLATLSAILGSGGQESSGFGVLIVSLINLLLIFLGYAVYLWFFARIFFPELPLSIEDEIDASESISRSWELTKRNVFRLQLIIVVSLLITLPLYLVAVVPFFVSIGYFSSVAIASATAITSSDITSIFTGLAFMGLALLLFLLVNFLMAPFWQALKAVIYYDLRSREEGLDLQLNDR